MKILSPGRWLLVLCQVLALACPATVRAQTGRLAFPESIRPVSADPADLPAARAGSRRAAISRAVLTPAETAAPLKIEFVLKTRHYNDLQRRVAAGETISPAEMAARFLPLPSDFAAVSQWLSAQGFAVAPPGAGRAMVIAKGSPALLQRTLETKFARVVYAGAEYSAAVSAPTLPAAIAAQVAGIHGLQPFSHPHKLSASVPALPTLRPPYLVSEILEAYDAASSGLTGAGQTIGIIIDTVPASADLTKFWSANSIGQSLSNISTVNVSGDSLPPPSGEETLDVSWSSGVAPGAQVVIYACGDLSNVHEAYSAVLDDLQSGARPNLHQLSMSYAAGEETDETNEDMASTSRLFTSMAAYGVTLFAASGDNGAFGDGGQTIQVNYPASDPSVVGVGGTSVTISPTGVVLAESAWSPYSDNNTASSGGGVSSYFARPDWQTGSTVLAGTMRLVPDVSMPGDPSNGAYVVFGGQVVEYGGTSWSSPTWAGLCALLNQGRANAGLVPLGPANTLFYPLLGTPCFRDITSGANGTYAAGVGYDLMTGLGVPDLGRLLSSLLGLPAPAAAVPAITSATVAAGQSGVAFEYQITASGSPTSFAANGLPAGLSVSPAGLISGTPAASGAYTVALGATSAAGTGTANLALTVSAAAAVEIPSPPVGAATPVVILTADSTSVADTDGQLGQFTVTRAGGDADADLTVFYSVGGSADPGFDYMPLQGRKKIKAGNTTAKINVWALGSDLGGAGARAVKVTLQAPGDASYTVGSAFTAKMKISNP